jgi:hypothetical protein
MVEAFGFCDVCGIGDRRFALGQHFVNKAFGFFVLLV